MTKQNIVTWYVKLAKRNRSGALPGKMLLVRMIENNKIDAD